MNQTKKKVLLFLLLCVISLGGCYLLSHSYGFYSDSILRVEKTTETGQSSRNGTNGRTELLTSQHVEALVLNGDYKGQTVSFESTYSASGLTTEERKPGDKLIVSLTPAEDNSLSVSIISEKRDGYLYVLITLFILCLVAVSGKKGVFTLLSLIINTLSFCLLLNHFETAFFEYIWIINVVLFIICTLLCSSGFHKKTGGAILSSFLAVFLIYLLFRLFVYEDDSISYEYMEYIIAPVDLRMIYMVSVVIGSLGAIMDVAITVNASVSELVERAPETTRPEVIHSLQEIGYDIMGTMINVLFFSYISSSMQLFILQMHSGYALHNILRYSFMFDIIRFLTGSIGIIVTIPLSGAIAILLFGKGRKKHV